MKTRVAIAVALLALPQAARAQGWVEPRPGPQSAGWAIEKLRTTVTVRVSGRVAQVEVEEWFRNNGRGLGEGDYVYPLPGEAVFTSYSLYQGDEELRGEMLDAARAREIYEGIVRAQRDPALIELIGKGMLRARVFPIAQGETRRITMRYTQLLERSGDALQFRYAAGARNSGVRPQREPAPLTFTLSAEDAARYREPFSPTHELRVAREGTRLTVRPRSELTGDVAVFLPFAEQAVGVTVATHRPPREDGYFMLTLSPGEAAASRVPRDLTVVVDVSGSMSGAKLEQARRALLQLLGTLGDNDRFRLIAFSNSVREWREAWTPATAARVREARQWVDELRADGGTNIHAALEHAFAAASPPARLPIVIFMTDGLPTSGETRPERIIAMAEAERRRARVFAFGVGYDVNTHLLDRLSEAARGTTQYVQPEEDVEDAVSVLAARVRHPVLTDLALQISEGARITEVYPRNLPDLFAGEELVLFGRYAGAGTATIGVSGRRNERTERFATDVTLPARAAANEYIPRLWAARKLGDLDRRIRSAENDGASREQVARLVDELRTTALRYGLLSEYTAYLVQEPQRVIADGVWLQAPPPPATATGQAAVARAEEARRAREATSMADMAAQQKLTAGRVANASAVANANARVVGGRAFVQRDSVWQDTRQAQQRVLEVEAFSPAWFAVLTALPEVALVLRELDTVLVAGERASIRVASRGVRQLTDAELRRLVDEFRSR